MAKSRRAADAFEAITGPAPSPPDQAVEPAPEAAPKRGRKPKGKATVHTTIVIEPKLKRRLRIAAFELDTDMSKIIAEAASLWLDAHGK